MELPKTLTIKDMELNHDFMEELSAWLVSHNYWVDDYDIEIVLKNIVWNEE